MTQNPFPNGSLQNATGFGPCVRNSFSIAPPSARTFASTAFNVPLTAARRAGDNLPHELLATKPAAGWHVLYFMRTADCAICRMRVRRLVELTPKLAELGAEPARSSVGLGRRQSRPARARAAALPRRWYIARDMGRPSLQQARAASGAQTARLSDGVTAYQVEGTSGPWVVLVHGLLTPMFAWEGVSSVLAREGYRVLRYDAFGRGLSDRPNIRYELPLYVRQLRELMDMIGIETMHLVSWSMGGLIASHFARERPDGVGSQVLIAPALFLRQPWALRIPLAMPRGERLIARRMGKIADDLVRSHLGRPERYPDYRARLSEQLSYPGLASSFASTLKHFAWQAGDELQDVGQHSRPVLVIWGDADRTTPYANAQRVLALYSKATLHTVPGARHAPHLDHAELVEPALVGFLATAGRVHSPSNSAVVPK